MRVFYLAFGVIAFGFAQASSSAALLICTVRFNDGSTADRTFSIDEAHQRVDASPARIDDRSIRWEAIAPNGVRFEFVINRYSGRFSSLGHTQAGDVVTDGECVPAGERRF